MLSSFCDRIPLFCNRFLTLTLTAKMSLARHLGPFTSKESQLSAHQSGGRILLLKHTIQLLAGRSARYA
jgi:hypothetical protein